MKTKWIEEEFLYDGSQLKSLFAYMKYGLRGDSCVAWIGGCDIPNEHMIDGEDLRAGETIAGKNMVHFICEKFHTDLFAGVALQRIMASIVKDALAELAPTFHLRREGDDLFFNDQKLSISIATRSAVSTLVHFAVNVTNEGTPVRTLCLNEIGVDPKKFAFQILEKFAAEVESIVSATEKVRPAGSH